MTDWLILAGGSGSRLGQDKAATPIDGRTLLDRARATIDSVDETATIHVLDQAYPGGPAAAVVAGSALALADEDAYRARLDCHPIRFALEETDDGTILSGVAFPDLGAARDRAKRARQAVESSKKDALDGGLKAAEKEGGFFLHEGRWVVSQRAGAAPPGALVHGASRRLRSAADGRGRAQVERVLDHLEVDASRHGPSRRPTTVSARTLAGQCWIG